MPRPLKPAIAELSLPEAVKLAAPDPGHGIDYSVTSFSSVAELDDIPRRASYFGIAVCLKGSVKLIADLEHYQLLPGSLIVMSPEVIRTWKGFSVDYMEETLLFTEAFFLSGGTGFSAFKQFRFFQAKAPKVIQLRGPDCNLIADLLQDIKNTIEGQTQRKHVIIRGYIHILLNRIADIYDEYCPDEETEVARPVKMVSRFKMLLMERHFELRSVNAYADLLNVSAKHLSQTVKEYTGKTAGNWIHEVLVLEAKVRLKQTSLTIAQIAAELNFSDPSLFGKYFKRYAGCTPAIYRKKAAG
ncbi:AraC family transcriptional activator of pobA [Pedobacter africanus]|uniref:AraC-like DNA-binding protein n=1 Tax=Pedobacter africanus TaxID=151894 RepID=A0ACC6KSN6_9SPHI|nr:helix-turn-helix domain-containing protein [Pedobacter africanus]MDR6782349.1 AraC-like DNA-binding protein [Pedobacter africanus]